LIEKIYPLLHNVMPPAISIEFRLWS
jgi:hypothetical protein